MSTTPRMLALQDVHTVQGSPMAAGQDVVTDEWFLVIMTEEGHMVDELALECLGRGGVRLLGEWASLARPSDADVWAMLDALPHTERATFLAMLDWDNGRAD